MRLVHVSDVHVYDPSGTAIERARRWGTFAIAAAALAGVLRADSTEWGGRVKARYPRLFRVARALAIAGISVYLVRKLVDHGHRRAYRAMRSEQARRALGRDLESMSFDHLLVTGDVALTPSIAEFEQAAEFFRPFWDRLHIVPGNHDVPFIDGATGDFHATFRERLEPFPYVRDLGEGVLLGGLDTTIRGMLQDPWALLSNARGRVTEPQLQAVRSRMPEAGVRVLAMHHHIEPNPSGRGGLVDRIYMGPVRGGDRVRRHMRDLGFDLVLHGHQHWNYFGPGYLCAGTSALLPDGGGEYPTYNVYDFESGDLVEARRREIRPTGVVETQIPVGSVLPRRHR
jgi:3',5'-cyclic AMP phosphodiesterase CpdA